MVRGRRRGEYALRVLDAADQLPGLFIEIGIEPRQHHRTLRKSGNGVEEFCSCRHRSGRACRNHRTIVMRGQALGFRLDQAIPPRRRLDLRDFREMGGPCLSRNPQEFERVLPIFVQLVRDQPVKRLPADPSGDHVVHQARQIAGQCKGRCGAADHKRRRDRRLCPRRDQPCQRKPAVEFAELRRNLQWRRATV